jgi:hypothetical protein
MKQDPATLIALRARIRTFLDTYGGVRAAYDPQVDPFRERWNSPDASELEFIHWQLESGLYLDRMPHSDWGHGGYKPYNSVEGRTEHDAILDQIRQLLKR